MTEFIELIKSIGFTRTNSGVGSPFNFHFSALKGISFIYNDYYLVIFENSKKWMMSKGELDQLNKSRAWLSINEKSNFALDEIGLLERHFKPELRELKLKELGL